MKKGDSHHNAPEPPLEQAAASDARLVAARAPEESNGYVAVPNSLAPRSRYSHYEEEQDQIDIQQLLDVLRRRWKLMLATLLSVIGLCVLYLLLAKPVYRATASLMIDAASSSSGASDIPGLSAMLDTSSQASSVDSQVEILKSYPVQMAAIQQLPEREREVAMALGNKPDKYITVDPVGKTAVVNVAVDSYQPQVAAHLADAVCAEYMKQSQEQKSK
ncbi:MAG TPA: Wzz/FepE/Etk N-terminal domain-containing protein, partial [Abditibacteriaceae bacterium]|nr:Wzz/FepE/Etk N-terminal domain-containing protein [Abditibacteriaceae bacterium]